MKRIVEGWILVVATVGTLAGFGQVFADTYTGTSWKINGTFGNSMGGSRGSASYNLVDSGGESIIGNGSGGSYTLDAGYVSQLQNSIQLSLQPNGLVGYWPFEESRGASASDLSINGNALLLKNNVTWGTGRVGGATSFAGASSQYAEAANIAALQSNSITASAWIKTSTTATGGTVIAKNGAWQLALSRSSPGKLVVHNQTGDTDVCVDSLSINDNAWHHVAMTMTSGSANGTKLYIDGSLRRTCTATVANQTGSVTVASLGASYYLTGLVDEAKVFNRVLTADEIKAEHAAGSAGSVSGVSLGTIIPGVSNVTQGDVVVLTDASGYNLAISQNGNLTNGSDTIPAISGGTIAAPVAWSEGTTKGLGFTLQATNATAIPAKWAAGANYAAFPGAATTFYTRSGSQSAKDYITLKWRVDVPSNQPATTTPYSNIVTVTGTYSP